MTYRVPASKISWNVPPPFPPGMISMWYGDPAKVPTGWALCDGENGTPDLSGRFIVGYSGSGDYDEIGNTGGQEEMPEHTHSIPSHQHLCSTFDTSDPDHTHSNVANHFASRSPAGTASGTIYTGYGGSGNTGAAGSGANADDNRPPYFVLAYIMKL